MVRIAPVITQLMYSVFPVQLPYYFTCSLIYRLPQKSFTFAVTSWKFSFVEAVFMTPALAIRCSNFEISEERNKLVIFKVFDMEPSINTCLV